MAQQRKRRAQIPKKGMWIIYNYDEKGQQEPGLNDDVPADALVAEAGRMYAGKKCIVNVYPFEDDKTLEQLGYYRGIMLPETRRALADIGTRWSSERTHFYLKCKCGVNDEFIDPVTREMKFNVRHHRDYSVEEMNIFIENVLEWTRTFLGITIPPPKRKAGSTLSDYFNAQRQRNTLNQ